MTHKNIALAGLLAVFAAACAGGYCAEVGSDKRPNLLLITADDLQFDSLGCFGSKVPEISPHLDRLAEQGMRFHRAHVDTAVCTPCRSTILTGRYPHRNGATIFCAIDPDVPTLHEILHKAGYMTGICGKGTISSRGLFYKGPWDYALGGGVDFDYARNAVLFYSNAKRFLDRAKARNKPFFLMMNTSDPHRPFHGSVRHEAAHLKNNSSRPSRIYQPEEIEVPGFLPDLPEVRRELAQYFTSVRRADDCIGATLRALDESGLAGNTLVVFLSDNGMAFPFAKNFCYPISTKTPLIVRWPGKVRPGTADNEHFVNSIDVMPTLLEAAGAALPEGMDGRSFRPLLLGEKQDGRESVFTQYDLAGVYELPNRRKAYLMSTRAVQNSRWCYVLNPCADGERFHGTSTFGGLSFPAMVEAAKADPQMARRVDLAEHRTLEEFYDLRSDPNCLNNLIHDPARAGDVKKMQDLLVRYMAGSDDYVLEGFAHRHDRQRLNRFIEDVFLKNREKVARSMRWPTEYYESIQTESPTGRFEIALNEPADVRVEVWTWHSKHVFSEEFSDTKDFVIDLSGNPKGTYQVTLHFADQVLTRKINVK